MTQGLGAGGTPPATFAQSAWDAAPIGAVFVDRDLRVTWANAAMAPGRENDASGAAVQGTKRSRSTKHASGGPRNAAANEPSPEEIGRAHV